MNKLKNIKHLWTLNQDWIDITKYPEPTYTTQVDDNLNFSYPESGMELRLDDKTWVEVNW